MFSVLVLCHICHSLRPVIDAKLVTAQRTYKCTVHICYFSANCVVHSSAVASRRLPWISACFWLHVFSHISWLQVSSRLMPSDFSQSSILELLSVSESLATSLRWGPYLRSQHDATHSSGTCWYRSISGASCAAGAHATAKQLLCCGTGGRYGSKSSCQRIRWMDARLLHTPCTGYYADSINDWNRFSIGCPSSSQISLSRHWRELKHPLFKAYSEFLWQPFIFCNCM